MTLAACAWCIGLTGDLGAAPSRADTIPEPRALALVRRAHWESASNSFEQQIDLESRLQRQAGRSEDIKEGVAAFLGKRPAKFQGR